MNELVVGLLSLTAAPRRLRNGCDPCRPMQGATRGFCSPGGNVGWGGAIARGNVVLGAHYLSGGIACDRILLRLGSFRVAAVTHAAASRAPLAQLDRASASGAEGQWFESTVARLVLR